MGGSRRRAGQEMTKRGKQQRPEPEPAVPSKRASALGILLQRENLLAVHQQLPAMKARMGAAEYRAWLAAAYPGLPDPLGMSANEFLYALGSRGSPELAELLTDPTALAELERIANGPD
jgi:hypothetical protein